MDLNRNIYEVYEKKRTEQNRKSDIDNIEMMSISTSMKINDVTKYKRFYLLHIYDNAFSVF